MRVIWENYYAEAHAIIYLVDAADEKRMLEAMDELSTFCVALRREPARF